MEQIKLQPECATTIIGSTSVASYCRFRTGARWYMTHRFESPDGGNVSVDVDEDNVPIGMQWINVDGMSVRQSPSATVPSPQEVVVRNLFMFAAQLALFGNDIQAQMTKPILRRVVESFSVLTPCA